MTLTDLFLTSACLASDLGQRRQRHFAKCDLLTEPCHGPGCPRGLQRFAASSIRGCWLPNPKQHLPRLKDRNSEHDLAIHTLQTHWRLKLDKSEASGMTTIIQSHPNIFQGTILRSISARPHLRNQTGIPYRREQLLEVLSSRKPAQSSNIQFTIVRITICSLFLTLRIRDIHTQRAPRFHFATVKLQGGFDRVLMQGD